MTTMAQRTTGFAAVLVFLFWIVAAALVAMCHIGLDALSASGSAVATITSIVLVAYAYTRLCARQAGIDHALAVGIAWLVLAIVVEITITSRLGHGFDSLIGTPKQPLLRNLIMFVWVFAPVLFARRKDTLRNH